MASDHPPSGVLNLTCVPSPSIRTGGEILFDDGPAVKAGDPGHRGRQVAAQERRGLPGLMLGPSGTPTKSDRKWPVIVAIPINNGDFPW